MENFEQLGQFYLGRILDPETQEITDKLFLYDSKNLTTHALCVGMTGSGKTGLGITILEEAALDKIPAIIIDPKGDLSNLALTFPQLSPADFKPWIDQTPSNRDEGVDALAQKEADTWKKGLAEWGETPERIQRLKDAAEVMIYTPASTAGVPISILRSFAAPPKEMLQDPGAVRDRVMSLASSLLGLLGISADPIKSREHILISTIIEQSWREGKDLSIKSLIQQVQKPPFNKIGVLDIETFFPKKERMDLSINLNNLLASPGFQAWMEGEPLDISQFLYTKQGKPKLAIFSIAHLAEPERMFFVTLLLNEILTWLRRQSGTSSLRALLYMDEIFGYFPPTSMPPSKMAMLTLLKQARAYGFGIVLCTQNPVDLDYKGLSNCGTWFIGKLQTERDKARINEGLKLASAGDVDSDVFNKQLSNIGKRNFIMHSIYEKKPIMFKTRWTMSYLRGPLTLTQISSLTEKLPSSERETILTPLQPLESSHEKPDISPDIPEYFINLQPNHQNYQPYVLGIAKLHFVDAKQKIDVWKEACLVASADSDGSTILWEKGKYISDIKEHLEKSPQPGSEFAKLPSGLQQEKNYSNFKKSFELFLYQNYAYLVFEAPSLNMISKEGESENDFRARLSLILREKRDEMSRKIKENYDKKIMTVTNKLKSAQSKATQKQQKAIWTKLEAFLSFFSTLLAAFIGRGITKGTVSQAGTSIRKASKIGKDSEDVTEAEASCETYQKELDTLHRQMQEEMNQIPFSIDPAQLKIESRKIPPRKNDISIDNIALVWISSMKPEEAAFESKMKNFSL